MSTPRFSPLIPGSKLDGDWFPGRIPQNILVGQNCVIDSSFCFKNYYSTKPYGLRLGNNVTIWRASFAVEENGSLEIGDNCYISNASLVVSESISVGSFVFIAGGVTIADSDFHPIDPAARLADTIALSPIGTRDHRPQIHSKPVIIGDDVWIGYNSAILKGVRIESGAVIAPGSVVIRDVQSGVTVAGNPAIPISDKTQ